MNYMKKTTFTRVVSAATAALLLVISSGCTTKTSSDVTTISVWTGDSHSKACVSQLVNDWNKTTGKEKGIYIDYQVKEGSQNDVIEMALTSETEPVLFAGGDIKKYSEAGYIAALEDMPGGEEYVNSYDKSNFVEGTHTYNGKTYKVPFYITTFGLVYNKDMFQKYGLVDENGEAKPPKTLTEMREYAKILTHPQNQEYGIILPFKNQWFFGSDVDYPVMRNQGYMSYNPITGKYDFSGYKDIFNMYLGIKEDKSYFPGAEGIDDDQARAQFSNGNIGMKFAGSYDVGVYNEQFPAKCDWDVAPYPVSEEGTEYYTRIASDGYLLISKRQAELVDKEKIMEVYKWFHGEEMLRALYQEGMAIPYDWNIVSDITLENPPKGWESFCKLANEGRVAPVSPAVDISGEKTAKDVFLDEIWTGQTSVDDACAMLTERYNRGLERKLTADSSIKLEDYIDTNWLNK